MHNSTSSNSSEVFEFFQDAQEFLETTLEAEKLSVTALEQRSRLVTRLSTLMTEYDGRQTEMYVDMSPTLKLTFKAFESSASENGSLRETQATAEDLYDLPPDFDGPDSSTKHPIEQKRADEFDGRAAEVAAAIANASVPKKKKGFIQRLFRAPSKKSSDNQNYENVPRKKIEVIDDFSKKVRELNDDFSKKEVELYDDVSKKDVELYDDVSKKEGEIYDETSDAKNNDQKSCLAPRSASPGIYEDTIIMPPPDIYQDVYAYETANGYFENMYQDYEATNMNNANDTPKNLEARENSVNKEFIGSMQEVFDQVGIDANMYDDTSPINQRIPSFLPPSFPDNPIEGVIQEENYDCIGEQSAPPEPIEDDADNVSVKSATSDYSNSNQTWTVSVPEAIKQAIIHGSAKRRNGKKILSAWRRCYCVLLQSHLLMFTDEGDLRPRIVIDLTQPNIEVKKLIKQGSDAKRLKLFPFVLTHENKPLYEICTKTREEAENWVAALQKVLWKLCRLNKGLRTNASNDDRNSQRIDLIQGRNLPSLPHREDNLKSLHASKPSLNSSTSFSSFNSAGKPENGSFGENFVNRQSKDDLICDDFYQELPSPVGTATPYSSVESINAPPDDAEKKYNSVDNVSPDYRKFSAPGNQSRICSEVFNWPPPPPPEELPTYDVPPTTVRPLGTNKNQNVFRYSKEDLSDEQDVYDVPATSPRPILNLPDKEPQYETYDEVATPPRPIIPSNLNNTKSATLNFNKSAPKSVLQNDEIVSANKPTRTWQDKINKNDKKDSLLPVKCLPQHTSESQSVGRANSRASPPRTPLSTLTELFGASTGGVLKPSALKKTQSSKFVHPKKSEGIKNEIAQINSASDNKLPSIVVDNNPNKKEKPPRPPAPVRKIPLRTTGEPRSLLDELKLRQTAPKIIQNLNNTEKSETEKVPEIVNQETQLSENSPEQYKARWAYVATNLLELSINMGEVVDVLGKNGPCWLVRARNKKGLVPKEYLVPV